MKTLQKNWIERYKEKLALLKKKYITSTVEVKHFQSDYNDDLIINADSWCDIGSHKVPEWNMQNMGSLDTSCCADCYEHYA